MAKVDAGAVSFCSVTHAHNNIRDKHMDMFSQKIGDENADKIPSIILITLDSNKKVNPQCSTHTKQGHRAGDDRPSKSRI